MQLSGVSKVYGGLTPVRALEDVSLTVQRGEFTAIVGHSGSGKSTLMHILGCLDTPTAGKYCLEGTDVSSLPDRQLSAVRCRHIGFVFQGFHLLPGLTALENVELPLYYRGVPRARRRALALAAMERVGLSDRVQHRPAALSGGQQQRTAIARAIAADPPLLLADEPTGNLDSAAGADILALLRALHVQGHTVVLITHDRDIAAACDCRVTIADGRIV